MAENILIVDPDFEDRQLLASRFQSVGLHAIQAVIYNDARCFLKRVNLDLIIFNNLIPTLNDGKKFINEIRTMDSDIYTAVLSSVKTSATVTEFLNLGVNDYFVKPIDMDIIFWRLNLKFKSMPSKDFARINLPEQSSAVCYFDTKAELASLSEHNIAFFVPYYVEPHSRISINSGFFKTIGIDDDFLDLYVSEVSKNTDANSDQFKYIAHCSMDGVSEENSILIRRWLIENRVLQVV